LYSKWGKEETLSVSRENCQSSYMAAL